MSSTAHHRRDGPTRATPSGGVVDVSELTVRELRAFVESGRVDAGEVHVERRGADAFLLAE